MRGHTKGVSDPENPPPLTIPRVLGRALALRCTVCGNGGVFKGPFKMAENCPTCGFLFQRGVHGHWIGALGMNTIVSFGAILLTVVFGFIFTQPDPPVGVLVAVTFGVAAIFPLVFFPWSRMLWSAIDLIMRPLEPDDEVDPRYWPGPGSIENPSPPPSDNPHGDSGNQPTADPSDNPTEKQ